MRGNANISKPRTVFMFFRENLKSVILGKPAREDKNLRIMIHGKKLILFSKHNIL